MKDLNGKNKGLPIILIIFSGFMFIGFILTFLLPETKGKTLEELNGENGDALVGKSTRQQIKDFFTRIRRKPAEIKHF